jgi:tRNA(Arg) A34 adenosine deaminase TadA
MTSPTLTVALPPWVDPFIDWRRRYVSLEDRMGLVLALAAEHVKRGSGGPFAAAIFERDAGRLVAVGVNLAVPNHNSVLHAETIALMMAETLLHSHDLGADGMPPHELVCSCDPCAMCLGAALWSGVSRVVAGADRKDAEAIGYDEGPVFPSSYDYLEHAGVQVVRGVRRGEARAVLEAYRAAGGVIY